jgi:hypothetical protein
VDGFGVPAGRSSRCGMLVALMAVLAMVSSLGADSSGQVAVVKATLSLSDFPVDVVGLSGRPPSPVDQATGGANPSENKPRDVAALTRSTRRPVSSLQMSPTW